MNKGREIVVGQLALGAGLITAGQLAQAMDDWSSGGSGSMGAALEARGFVDPATRAELERIADRGDIGGDGPGLGLLSTLAVSTRAPVGPATVAGPGETAPAETIATALVGETIRDPSTGATVDLHPTRTADHLATRATEPFELGHHRLRSSLGDPGPTATRGRYDRTHIHAKGGIGQVWLARDADLGREVALKELRPEQGKDPISWARFVEEARITGQLEHPGIVPIYELSSRPEDDYPFYTMRFIRGRTLGEVIRDYHEKKAAGADVALGLASLLTSFVTLCNTAGYAHSRGVVHRDLKGQNVVLGDFGEVVLLDWGIAKLVGRPGPAEGDLAPPMAPVSAGESRAEFESTFQGQVLGTPRYMAPEQAEGRIDEIDARTDVYGLGAILYEILTGRPPFHGDTTVEVLRKVSQEPPAPPREVVPGTPRALEAICLKAMAKRREDRYPTAMALAEDVRRWQADEPVSVYREPWTIRAARWSKRHRSAVASAAAVLVMAVAALSVSAVLIGRERDEARRQRQQARKAVDDNYTRVAESWLADRLDPLQREFLEKALAYYRDFAGPDEGDPSLRQERGRAYLRMGDVLRKLGRHDEAEDAYRRSIEILSALASDRPGDLEHRDHLAEATFRLGSGLAVRVKAADLDEAGRLFRQAASTQEAQLAEGPSTARRVALGRTLASSADLLRSTGKPDDAESAYRQAIALLEKAVADEPDGMAPRQELGAALDGLGVLLKDRGKVEEARAADRRAVEVFERLVAEGPTLPMPRDGLARAYNSLGLLLRDVGASKEAEGVLEKEVALNR